MKKVLALLLSGAMTVSLLAGCGNTGTNSSGSTDEGSGGSGTSGQEELPSYSFQLGFNTVEDSVRGEMAHVFADYVNEASGGRITVEIFPNSSLGSEQEMVEALQQSLCE